MIPTFLTLLPYAMKYAPEAEQFIGHIVANIAAGRANDVPSDDDWAELTRLSANTSDAIYKRLGIAPPPAAK